MGMTRKNLRNLAVGLGFLAPNILGFLAFTVIPLVLSMVLAFTNWDLRLHNMFKTEPIQFVGFGNFQRLLSEPDFRRFLGNTLFIMIGIPFGIAGSLLFALLLNKDLRGGGKVIRLRLLVGALVVFTAILLTAVGMGATAITLLLISLAGLMLIGGVAGGSALYRTLFYLPNFTAGVAVYILWSKLYNPNTGPINSALKGPLQGLTVLVRNTPTFLYVVLVWILLAVTTWITVKTLLHFYRQWRDGELGTPSLMVPVGLVLLPLILGQFRLADVGGTHGGLAPIHLAGLAVALCLVVLVARGVKGRDFPCPGGEGFGGAAIIAMGVLTLQFILIGLSNVVYHLPAAAAEDFGITPPQWLASIHWAKPAIMIMGFWAAIGSNNMLLYLAGLSNVPPELFEAADIDGANRRQRFWNVTWPQLAPTTFFIVVMSTIGGLQGGFEMARTMTRGGPAGATTTLSYFVFTEGFETGRLGFASATAWTLFLMIFILTIFNWKFGNRYVND
ncbi:MAG: sugar ABC transporter permease [Phycisphaerae bacterium]|nr:sugar ABC transporter permease [Phycisphaerae bacterium]